MTQIMIRRMIYLILTCVLLSRCRICSLRNLSPISSSFPPRGSQKFCISLPSPNLAMAALISLSFFTSISPSFKTVLSKSHCTETLESTSNLRWIENKTQELVESTEILVAHLRDGLKANRNKSLKTTHARTNLVIPLKPFHFH